MSDKPEKPLVLALDQGTTSSRAILFDHSGTAVRQSQQEFRQHYPQPGWVEHDALEILESQLAVARDVLAGGDVAGRGIAAIGITNQRETTVLWDRETGRPVCPAIVWQDRRTAPLCSRLKEAGLEGLFRQKTGLVLDPYFSGTKLAWMLDRVEGARRAAEAGRLAFGTIDSWLLWNLTGGAVHATDASNASRTLLMNLQTGDWDDDILSILEIPRGLLPQIRGSSEQVGRTAIKGLPAGIPISGIAGDQQAALFGQACFTPGMAKNTYGTGCFLLMHTGDRIVHSDNNLLTTVAWKIGDRIEYALEGSVFIAGAVIQWLRDELHLIGSAAECDELAASVPDSQGLFLVPAFAGLGAPHWDPHARGLAIGLTRGTNRAHVCRAALEAIAFQTVDLIAAMEKDTGVPLRELRVDGGAARSAPLLQIQADLLQVPVVRPHCLETTALGAAYLAGLAVGYWEDRAQIACNWAEDGRMEPRCGPEETVFMRKGWAKAVERCKNWESA